MTADVFHACRILRRWPADQPLAALVSADATQRWSRRSLFATPQEIRTIRVPRDVADPARAVEVELRQAMRRLDRLNPSPHTGWFVSFSYELGRVFEPRAVSSTATRSSDDRDWPVATLAWCPDVLVLDHEERSATIVGDPERVPIGAEEALREGDHVVVAGSFRFGDLRDPGGRAAYERAVDRCVRLIHDGDIFQANIARRLSADFTGSTRALAEQAFAASRAWFGAYLEADPGRTIISMSPELFLALDGASRRVVTRPIKGTRPSDADVRELLQSSKDAAELAMIVDLMRNDLGRVAEIGSVAVDAPRDIETHSTVHHAVSQVSATLAAAHDRVDLLKATFPPGSVTGAPKVRAMQVIDELETLRRGPYCGATGILASDGSLMLNVAIRTMALSGRGNDRTPGELDGVLDYWAGCGIVAESDPALEWDESVAKTAVLLLALRNAIQAA